MLLVSLDQIGADARGDEDAAYTGNFAQFREQLDLFLVRWLQVGANGRGEATSVFAGAPDALAGAVVAEHIGCGATNVGDDAVETL